MGGKDESSTVRETRKKEETVIETRKLRTVTPESGSEERLQLGTDHGKNTEV